MFFGKEVKVFLKGQAKEKYFELRARHEKPAKSVFRSVERVKDILKDNPQFGDPLRKQLIPSELGVQNLYRVELSNFWRLLYTLEGNESGLFVFVVKIFSHEEYDAFFGYG